MGNLISFFFLIQTKILEQNAIFMKRFQISIIYYTVPVINNTLLNFVVVLSIPFFQNHYRK